MVSKKVSFRISEEIINKLYKLFPKGRTLTQIISEVLKDYIKRKEDLKVEDRCPCLVYTGVWECVWFRDMKPPLVRVLGRDLEYVLNICEACKRGKKIYEERKLYKRLMADGISVKIPYCMKGGRISEDLKQFYCPDLTEWVKLTWCIKRERGANCRWLRFVRVRKKLKEKEVIY